jgi:dipeptidase D
MTVTASLEPQVIWKHFETLASIPRPSKEEGRVLEYIKTFAKTNNLEWKEDSSGNLCVKRPGSAGGENAPTVVIQGHVDMVCEKEKGTVHDFSKDAIKLQIKDDWVTAVGTTLGADNGMGVAAGLALLEMPDNVTLPPIEGLFTVQEEIGLIGAKALDGGIVDGRILINLDAEDWPNIYVGCAGGGLTHLSLSCTTERLPDSVYQPALLTVGGLTGGVSCIAYHLAFLLMRRRL